jgi:signal transduction histidine kinase/CheY-like chemotaxis protein
MITTPERVLVLAPTGRDAALSRDMLRNDGIEAQICETMDQLSATTLDDVGALLLGEEALTPAAIRQLTDVLDRQPPWSDIPVVLVVGAEFTSSGTRSMNVLGPLRNAMVLERPVRRLILTRSLEVALRARRRQWELRAYLDERTDLLRREQLANRMKDEFLMTVSHELRTPLTAIYGWARMLATGAIRDEQRQRAIEVIERNAQAQTQLVNDLLDVSRAISGKVRLDVRPMDLEGLVATVIDSVKPTADARHIRIELDCGVGSGQIVADRERLQQVIWNLVSNAIKFTPAGGRIDVQLRRLESQVQLTVSDTGRGIEADFLPYVFDRFRQGDAGTTRQHGGLGLGLAIVRHLVELHGGTVSVESDGLGRGARFHIRLPAPIGRADYMEVRRFHQNAGGGEKTNTLEDIRILVVDDEPETRELLCTVVENAGAEVRGAASAHDAVTVLRAWSPDVLLSDIEMPYEDGYVLMEQIAMLGLTADHRPIAVAVTAHSRPEDRLKAAEAGFQWHLPKPIEPSELVAVVASLTGRLQKP